MLSKIKFLPHLALSLLLLLETCGTVKAHTNVNELALQVAQSNNVQQTPSLFNESIQVAEAIPNQAQKIKVLSAIAVKLAAAKQTQQSGQLFDEVINLAKQTNASFSDFEQQMAWRDISIQLAGTGQSRRGLELVKTISSNFRKAEALNGIAASLADQGQWEQARQVLLEALQNARGITGDYAYESNGSCSNDKFDVLSKIAGNLSLLGRLESALQVAQSVYGCASATGESTQDYQSWAFLGILGHIAKVDQLKETWSNAQTIRNPAEKAKVWSAIAIKLIDMGETPLALSIAKKLALDIPPPTKIDLEWTQRNFQSREQGLRDIAVEFAQKQNFDVAMEVTQNMTEPTQPEFNSTFDGDQSLNPSIKDLTLGEIASQLALTKKVSQALQLANNIPNTEAKTLALISIAGSLQNTGDSAQAAQILGNLQLPPTGKKPNDYYGYQPLKRVAVALANVQLDQALAITQSIKDHLVQETTFTDIASELADSGKVDSALKLLNNLQGKGSQATVLLKVASKLVELGKLEQAYKLISPIDGSSSSLDGSEKVKLLVKIVNQYARQRQKSQAIQAAENIADPELKAETIADIAQIVGQ